MLETFGCLRSHPTLRLGSYLLSVRHLVHWGELGVRRRGWLRERVPRYIFLLHFLLLVGLNLLLSLLFFNLVLSNHVLDMLGPLFLKMSLLRALLLLLEVKPGLAFSDEALAFLYLFLTILPLFLFLLIFAVLSFLFPFLLSSFSFSLFFGQGALCFILCSFSLL